MEKMFLQINGIAGSVTEHDHEGSFVIDNFGSSLSCFPQHEGNEQVDGDMMHVSLKFEAACVRLEHALTHKLPLQKAVVTLINEAEGKRTILTYTFQGLRMRGYHFSAGGDFLGHVSVVLSYEIKETSLREEDASGLLQTKILTGYNFKEQHSLADPTRT